jgi:hypothetical protein
VTSTAGLIPVADVPCLLDTSAGHVRGWIDRDVLPVIEVDGAAYATRADVDRLRHPARACAAEIDAALTAGRDVPPLDLVVRVVSHALRADRS